MNYCKNCGQLLGDGERVCPSCGATNDIETTSPGVGSGVETPHYPTKICNNVVHKSMLTQLFVQNADAKLRKINH